MTLTITPDVPAAPPDEAADPPVRTCKAGHRIEGWNACKVRHVSGRYYIACRQCRYDSVRRTKARQRGEEVPLQGPIPVPKTEPRFDTVELWTALPVDLRQRVAGIMLDKKPPDPLVAAVIRRAARKRVWVRLGVSFATIALIEALVESSRESSSSRLRIDKVLTALLLD